MSSFPDNLADRFRRFKQRHFLPNAEGYEELATHGQTPETLIISCSDSRVVPDLLVSTDPGDLFVMRNAIQQYTLDKEAGPASLDDLVSSGYLREVPRDPITRQKEWTTSSDDILASPDQATTGISDVHSISDAIYEEQQPKSHS